VEETEEKSPLGRPRRRWQCNMWSNLRKRAHLEDLGVGGRVICGGNWGKEVTWKI